MICLAFNINVCILVYNNFFVFTKDFEGIVLLKVKIIYINFNNEVFIVFLIIVVILLNKVKQFPHFNLVCYMVLLFPLHTYIVNEARNEVSWTGWAWSWMPSLYAAQTYDDIFNDQYSHLPGPTFHAGFYMEQASVSLKVCHYHHLIVTKLCFIHYPKEHVV